MDSPKYSLENKVVAVVGCVAGIGLATVEILLAKKNIKGLALLDLNEKSGEELLDRLTKEYPSKKITFNKCDVTVKEDIEKAFDVVWETFSNVDVLINLAGVVNDKNWRLSIDINLTGLIESSLQGLARMRRDRGGSGGTILNVSSLAGVIPMTFLPIYSATKFAVRSFTTSLGLPCIYSKTDVRALTVCPFVTKTAIFEDPSEKVFDPSLTSAFTNFIEKVPHLPVEFTAGGLLEAYENGESASSWAIVNDRVEVIPETHLSVPLSFLEN